MHSFLGVAGEVVQWLRNFFRGGAFQLERISVKRLIEGALEPMREDARGHGLSFFVADRGFEGGDQ
jgi:hypothetical protein